MDFSEIEKWRIAQLEGICTGCCQVRKNHDEMCPFYYPFIVNFCRKYGIKKNLALEQEKALIEDVEIFRSEDVIRTEVKCTYGSLVRQEVKKEEKQWESEIHPFVLDCHLLGGSKNFFLEKPLRDDLDFLDMHDILINEWRYIKNVDKEIYDGMIMALDLTFVASFKNQEDLYSIFAPDMCLLDNDMYKDLSQFFETYMSIGMDMDVAIENDGSCPVDFSIVLGYAQIVDRKVSEVYEFLSNRDVQHVAKLEKGQSVVLHLEKYKEFLDYKWFYGKEDHKRKSRVGGFCQYKRPVLVMKCKLLGEGDLSVSVGARGHYQICLMNPSSCQMMNGWDLKKNMKLVDCFDNCEPRIGFEILRYPRVINFYMEEDIKKSLYYRGSYGSYLEVLEKQQKEKIRKSKRKKRRKIKRNFGKDLERVTNDEMICVVCLDVKRDTCFRPCSHIVVCGYCSSSLKECPICRSPIQESFIVIFS